MDPKTFVFYFLLGGLIVALSSYYGGQGRGFWAAFIGLFPSVTFLTFIFSYLSGGIEAALNFAKGLLVVIPGWILYVLGMLYFLPRIGIYLSLSIGLFLFIFVSLILRKLLRLI